MVEANPKLEMENLTGPLLTAGEVGNLLGITPYEVTCNAWTSQYLGLFDSESRDFLFPRGQFVEGEGGFAVIDGLYELFEKVGYKNVGEHHSFILAAWLNTPSEDLSGLTPYQHLTDVGSPLSIEVLYRQNIVPALSRQGSTAA